MASEQALEPRPPRPWVAAGLSLLLPGLGHLYARRPVVFALAALGAPLLALVSIYGMFVLPGILSPLVMVGVLILIAALAVHAWRTAKHASAMGRRSRWIRWPLLVGIVLAGRFADDFAGVLTFIPDDWSKIAAFAIILVAVMIVAWILGTVLSKLISLVLLGWVNRIAGAVLGLFIGAFFMGAILSIWVNYLGPSETVSNSALANFLLDKFPIALGLLPSEFDPVRNFFD